MMAKREEEMEEIRSKSTQDINEEIIDLKGELFMLRLQKSARGEFKSSEFGRMRKRVARMLTVRREREIADGINKRLSRKLDKKWKKSIVVRPPPSLKKLQEEQKAAEAAEQSTYQDNGLSCGLHEQEQLVLKGFHLSMALACFLVSDDTPNTTILSTHAQSTWLAILKVGLTLEETDLKLTLRGDGGAGGKGCWLIITVTSMPSWEVVNSRSISDEGIQRVFIARL
ncbi:hypothetical protein ACLOJK_016264 [Asimina triloba]